jgi:hypothetical protein
MVGRQLCLKFAGAASIFVLAGAVQAQMADGLVGTWQVVSITNTAADGTVTHPYGDHPTGSMIADSNGRFVLMLLDPDVPKFVSNNRIRGTAEENAAAVRGNLAYFGTYSLAGTTAKLTLAGSTYPNWTGTTLTFSIRSITPDRLTWSVAAAIGGETQTEWRRLK